jgi:adenosylhomocysteinase
VLAAEPDLILDNGGDLFAGYLANAGHFPAEIDAAGLIGAAQVVGRREYADDLVTLELDDGRRVHMISRGHMFNLAGPRP